MALEQSAAELIWRLKEGMGATGGGCSPSPSSSFSSFLPLSLPFCLPSPSPFPLFSLPHLPPPFSFRLLLFRLLSHFVYCPISVHFNSSLCSHFSHQVFCFLSFFNHCRYASTERYAYLKSGEDKTLSEIIFSVVSFWRFLELSCPQNTIV